MLLVLSIVGLLSVTAPVAGSPVPPGNAARSIPQVYLSTGSPSQEAPRDSTDGADRRLDSRLFRSRLPRSPLLDLDLNLGGAPTSSTYVVPAVPGNIAVVQDVKTTRPVQYISTNARPKFVQIAPGAFVLAGTTSPKYVKTNSGTYILASSVPKVVYGAPARRPLLDINLRRDVPDGGGEVERRGLLDVGVGKHEPDVADVAPVDAASVQSDMNDGRSWANNGYDRNRDKLKHHGKQGNRNKGKVHKVDTNSWRGQDNSPPVVYKAEMPPKPLLDLNLKREEPAAAEEPCDEMDDHGNLLDLTVGGNDHNDHIMFHPVSPVSVAAQPSQTVSPLAAAAETLAPFAAGPAESLATTQKPAEVQTNGHSHQAHLQPAVPVVVTNNVQPVVEKAPEAPGPVADTPAGEPLAYLTHDKTHSLIDATVDLKGLKRDVAKERRAILDVDLGVHRQETVAYVAPVAQAEAVAYKVAGADESKPFVHAQNAPVVQVVDAKMRPVVTTNEKATYVYQTAPKPLIDLQLKRQASPEYDGSAAGLEPRHQDVDNDEDVRADGRVHKHHHEHESRGVHDDCEHEHLVPRGDKHVHVHKHVHDDKDKDHVHKHVHVHEHRDESAQAHFAERADHDDELLEARGDDDKHVHVHEHVHKGKKKHHHHHHHHRHHDHDDGHEHKHVHKHTHRDLPAPSSVQRRAASVFAPLFRASRKQPLQFVGTQKPGKNASKHKRDEAAPVNPAVPVLDGDKCPDLTTAVPGTLALVSPTENPGTPETVASLFLAKAPNSDSAFVMNASNETKTAIELLSLAPPENGTVTAKFVVRMFDPEAGSMQCLCASFNPKEVSPLALLPCLEQPAEGMSQTFVYDTATSFVSPKWSAIKNAASEGFQTVTRRSAFLDSVVGDGPGSGTAQSVQSMEQKADATLNDNGFDTTDELDRGGRRQAAAVHAAVVGAKSANLSGTVQNAAPPASATPALPEPVAGAKKAVLLAFKPQVDVVNPYYKSAKHAAYDPARASATKETAAVRATQGAVAGDPAGATSLLPTPSTSSDEPSETMTGQEEASPTASESSTETETVGSSPTAEDDPYMLTAPSEETSTPATTTTESAANAAKARKTDVAKDAAAHLTTGVPM